MSKKTKQLKEFLVNSADWKMKMSVETDIFDDAQVEACTRCIEHKIRNLKPDEDFLINAVVWVKAKNGKKTRAINTYKLLLNAGFPKRAEMFRKIFYSSTKVDLSNEPL